MPVLATNWPRVILRNPCLGTPPLPLRQQVLALIALRTTLRSNCVRPTPPPDLMPLPFPSTRQVLALIALRSRDTITAHNLAIVRANLKLAEAFFEEFKHMFEWCPPAAGSVAFPRCGRYRG